MRCVIVALVALLVGCTAPTNVAEEWSLGGSFTQGYTRSDEDAVCQAGSGASRCAILESEPPQFGFRYPSEAKCEEARAAIMRVPHTSVRDCVHVS